MRLNRAIQWSAAFHILLSAAFLIQTQILSQTHTPYIPALKVDIVGLPDILKKDLDKVDISKPQDEATTKPSASRPTKDTDEIGLKKVKSKSTRHDRMSSAVDRLRALEKLRETSPVIKGNKVSPGSSLTGESVETLERSYFDDVHSQVLRYWELPPILERQRLDAQVRVFINASGYVVGLRFEKRSGNPRFDDIVRNTVERSHPFPKPPKEIAKSLERNGILLGFPL